MSLGGEKYRNNFDVDPIEEDQLLNTSIDKLQALTGDKTLPRGKRCILLIAHRRLASGAPIESLCQAIFARARRKTAPVALLFRLVC